MSVSLTEYLETIPQGRLGIIAMRGCEELAQRVSDQIVEIREKMDDTEIIGYHRDSYILDAEFPRFSTGEGKGVIRETIRGYDLFIISDCFNYSVTYKMYDLKDADGNPLKVPMSPDDHFADLKRIISANAGKARRVSVIMPMLYEGRQHKRSSRESLDCAMALRELENLDRIPAEQGGDLYLINGSMLPMQNAGAFANTETEEKEETEDGSV